MIIKQNRQMNRRLKASIKKISFGACISTYGCMLRFFDPERPRECGTLTVY